MSGRPVITRNALHCHECDTVIESTHTYDFRHCQCPFGSETSIFVDGGHSYLRRGWAKKARFTDLSETEGQPS